MAFTVARSCVLYTSHSTSQKTHPPLLPTPSTQSHVSYHQTVVSPETRSSLTKAAEQHKREITFEKSSLRNTKNVVELIGRLIECREMVV